MCRACKARLQEIRRAVVYEREALVTGVYGYTEVGCWVCNGRGMPTHSPFQEDSEGVSWNIYVVSRLPFHSIHEAMSEASFQSIEFSRSKAYTWAVKMDGWVYASPDLQPAHEYSGLIPSAHADRSEETIHCVVKSGLPEADPMEFFVRVLIN